jgi:hypothetical protein
LGRKLDIIGPYRREESGLALGQRPRSCFHVEAREDEGRMPDMKNMLV